MRQVLTFAAVAEAVTGLALLIVPSLVGRLLLGAELTDAIPVARVAGIALIALGVCCWPGSTVLCGMLTYGAVVTLLWPAVVLHAVLTLLHARAWFQLRKPD